MGRDHYRTGSTLYRTRMPLPSEAGAGVGGIEGPSGPLQDRLEMGPLSLTANLSPRPPGAGRQLPSALGQGWVLRGEKGRERKQAGKLGSPGVQRPQSIHKGIPRPQREPRAGCLTISSLLSLLPSPICTRAPDLGSACLPDLSWPYNLLFKLEYCESERGH